MKKNRMISLTAVLLMALCGVQLFIPARAYAAEAEKTGYWEFVERWDKQSDSLTVEGSNYKEVISGSASSGFSDRATITEDGYRFSGTNMDDRLHHGTSCKGESGEALFTFGSLPGTTLKAGEELAITANVSCSTSGHHVGVGGQVMIDYCSSSPDSNDYVYFRQQSDNAITFAPAQIWQAEGKSSGGHSDAIGSNTGTFSATIPKGSSSDSTLYIRFHFICKGTSIDTIYGYRWVDTTPVSGGVTESGGTIGSTEKETVPGEISSLEETGSSSEEEVESTETPKPISQTVTQNAREDSGEDNGAGIIPAIILGIGGALAAAGILGSSSGKNKNNSEDKKKRAFRMKVYKNFGDSIRRGAKPVTVWARIVEIIDGEEINRPELSARITVSGTGMEAHSLGVQNTYMGAEVSIPADSEAQTAILTFTFTGEGGVFSNNIIFKVLGEPQILFPAASEDGTHWNVNDQNNQVDMIAGVRVRERLRFVITNAAQEPKAIRFRDHDGFDITYEKDPQWQFTYYACIENKTAPIEKESGIFAAMVSTGARVEAEFEDGITIWSYISIRLFPEGLAAKGKLENGRLTVNTLPLENPTEGFAKILPTVFSLTLAYQDRNGHTVVAEEPRWTPVEFRDDGKYGQMFRENFRYKIKYQSASEIAFYPEDTLPMLTDPYEVYLEIDAWTDDGSIRAELPMLFYGDKAAKRTDDQREQALRELRATVRFFGAGTDETTRTLLHGAKNQTAEELAFTRQWIILTATQYYKNEKKSFESIDQYMTHMIRISNVFVYLGDWAIEILLERAAGKLGKEAGKILNPLKNMQAEFIGDCIGDMIDGRPVDLNANRLYKFYLQNVDTLMDKVLTGGLKPSGDTLGYVVATYLLNRFTYNYFYGEPKIKGDVYRSVCASFGDLTLMYFKSWYTELLGNHLKKGLGKWGDALAKWTGSGVLVPWLAETLLRRGLRSVRHEGEQIMGDSDKFEEFDSSTDEMIIQGLEFYVKQIFKEEFDLTVEDVYEVAGDKMREQMKTLVQIEGTTLKLNVYGVTVTIPLITSNISTFIDMFFDFAFGWMKDIWNNDPKQYRPPLIPDIMDNPVTDESVIERQMERVRNLQPTIPTITYTPGS